MVLTRTDSDELIVRSFASMNGQCWMYGMHEKAPTMVDLVPNFVEELHKCVVNHESNANV